MSKKKRQIRSGTNSRDAPEQKRGATVGFLTSDEAWKVLVSDGYRPLTECPEVQTAVRIYAELISSMTIHLMHNTDKGDVRVKNQLSRKIDIEPNRYMTRQSFISALVQTLMLEGDGNQITIPEYKNGMLEALWPVPPSQVSFREDGNGYKVVISGHEIDPDEVLHFVANPDPERPWMGRGYAANLRDVVKSLRQANSTKKALMESPMPSIIVKVDGLTEEFASAEGRKKLREQYIDASENGRPWFIPAEAFSVEQVKPATIKSMAIAEGVELDKREIAAIIGVPPFMLGVGKFDRTEYNWFVQTKIMARAQEIEQVLTKGILYSDEWYFRFNQRSLLNYDIQELISAGAQMADRMALRRNEWRDWVGLPPDADMDELLGLENYIPVNKMGDQKKLKGGEE